MQKRFDDILQKRMDRKDFLKHVGLGVAVMTGVAGALKVLNPQAQQQAQEAKQASSMAYGGSAYGGRPATAAPQK